MNAQVLHTMTIQVHQSSKIGELMRYTEITLDQMKSLLISGWSEVTGSSATREYVYEKVINEFPKIVIKVYTSISKSCDFSRSKGDDAIRVCAVDLTNKVGWIKTVRVFRVEGWKQNLSRAISKVIFESGKRLQKLNAVMPKVAAVQLVATKIDGLYHPCWTKCDEKEYSTEASDLDVNTNRYRRDICPHCGDQFAKKDLTQVKKDNENEIQYWEFSCPSCKSSLVVFND